MRLFIHYVNLGFFYPPSKSVISAYLKRLSTRSLKVNIISFNFRRVLSLNL